MSGLFDEEDGLVPGAKPSEEPEVATPVVEEIGLFSDEAKADMRAARDKAKAVAKEKAKQAGQAATQVATKARAEWLPKAKAWWAAERAKGIHKGVWIFGVGMALLTVGASGAIWWHAQPHLTAPKAEAPKVEVPATSPNQEAPTPVVQAPAPVAQTPPVAPAPQVQPQVEAVVTTPDVKEAPAVEAPAPVTPRSTTRALKPLPFNPTSREYRSAAPKPKATASKAKAKTAWEKEQEAKLDAFFKH